MRYDPIAASEGRPLTLAEYRALKDELPPLSPKYARRFEQFGQAYESHLRGMQRATYDTHRQRSQERAGDIKTGADLLRARIAELISQANAGRITGAELRKAATDVHKSVQMLREWSTEGRTADESAWEAVCTDAAEFQAAQLEQTPMLQRTLPSLTQGYLDGNPEFDPFTNND